MKNIKLILIVKLDAIYGASKKTDRSQKYWQRIRVTADLSNKQAGSRY